MSAEQQSLLEGLEPDVFSQTDPESDGLAKENTAPERPPDPADPTGASASTAGNTFLSHDQEPQKGDDLSVSEEDSDESDPSVQTPSSEDVSHEYPISSWAMLSPEKTVEQERQLDEYVERNGVIVPVDVLNGEVLDGRYRETARRKTGKPPNFNFLPDNTDVVSHLLSKNALRGHYDENDRAIYAYMLWQNQFVVAGIKPGTSSANLRNFKSQEDIARLLNVSARSVSSVASVLGPRSTACTALQEAVKKRQIKASDAQRVLNKPASIQHNAVAMVARGDAKTVLAAARMVEGEKSHKEASSNRRVVSLNAADGSITLHQAAVFQMTRKVAEGSVDAIIMFPSPDSSMFGCFVDLAAFAAHALKPDGVMAVLTSGLQLPFVIERLTHPDLHWVAEFDYRPPTPSRSGPPLNLTLRRSPVLIYGRSRYQLRGGDDVIEVSTSEDGASGTSGGRRLDVGMAMIVERLTLPGQLVCDPLMLTRSASALAAWSTGRAFIGATATSGNLTRIKAGLSREGVPFVGD